MRRKSVKEFIVVSITQKQWCVVLSKLITAMNKLIIFTN